MVKPDANPLPDDPDEKVGAPGAELGDTDKSPGDSSDMPSVDEVLTTFGVDPKLQKLARSADADPAQDRFSKTGEEPDSLPKEIVGLNEEEAADQIMAMDRATSILESMASRQNVSKVDREHIQSLIKRLLALILMISMLLTRKDIKKTQTQAKGRKGRAAGLLAHAGDQAFTDPETTGDVKGFCFDLIEEGNGDLLLEKIEHVAPELHTEILVKCLEKSGSTRKGGLRDNVLEALPRARNLSMRVFGALIKVNRENAIEAVLSALESFQQDTIILILDALCGKKYNLNKIIEGILKTSLDDESKNALLLKTLFLRSEVLKKIWQHISAENLASIHKLMPDWSERIQKKIDAKPVEKAHVEDTITLAEAAEIMVEDFLGPEAVAKTFGVELRADKVPPIPFTKAELKRAKQLGQYLHLEVKTLGNGKPLTMANLDEFLRPKYKAEGKGNVLHESKGWKKKEPFFTGDTPELGWRLSTKDVLPGSAGKNDLEQTAMLAEYVTQVFDGQEMPQEYSGALKEFEEKKAIIAGLLYTNWKEAARMLSELQLNGLCRRSPVSALAANNLYFDNTGKRLMTNKYEGTSRLSSDGSLVSVGRCDSAGAVVSGWYPSSAHGSLGVVFARSQ